VLKITNINVFYGQTQILKEVSFDIEKGEIVSLVGANAAGKSTALNSISGLVPLRGGEILFGENRIDRLQSHNIIDLGIVQVPEGRKIFPYMTVRENLEMGGYSKRAREQSKQFIKKVYDLFPRLAERQKQLGESLSGGEQQMLAIGRGLMTKPEILMLDEPSLGLAPIVVQAIFDVVKQVNEQGVTILLVEQNVKRSLAASKHGYVLENGRITLKGTGEELLRNAHLKKAFLGL
jgi:branched-chain amino acid transport system ATP-binding protein